MASASKRRKNRRPATRKKRPAAALLDAVRDPIRKQEVDKKRGTKSESNRPDPILPISAAPELIELMNRRTKAFAELPLRIARSRTPFEAWRHQSQFVEGLINDVEAASLHIMRAGFAWFPK